MLCFDHCIIFRGVPTTANLSSDQIPFVLGGYVSHHLCGISRVNRGVRFLNVRIHLPRCENNKRTVHCRNISDEEQRFQLDTNASRVFVTLLVGNYFACHLLPVRCVDVGLRSELSGMRDGKSDVMTAGEAPLELPYCCYVAMFEAAVSSVVGSTAV